MKKTFLSFFAFALYYTLVFSQQVTYDWQHVIPGNTYTALCCMANDSSGNIYVGGRLDSTITFVDTTVTNTVNTGFLAKFDSDGNRIWFKQFEYSGTVYSICFDSEDKLYISGMYFGKVRIDDTLLYTHDVDTTVAGMFLAKFDTDGNRIWAKTTAGLFYYESDYAKLKQMTIDRDDNIVLAGTCINEIEYFDTTITYTKILDSMWVTTPFPHWVYYYATTNYLAKYNKHGQKLWIKDAGMHQQHYLAIATDYSNNILLTGYFWDDYPFVVDSVTLNASGGENIFIIKYNPNGKLIWAQRGGGASSGPNRAYDIVSDDLDDIFITGIIYGNSIEFGDSILNAGVANHLFITKYNSSGVVEWFKHYGTNNSAYVFGRGLGLSFKNNEIFLCGFFLDTLDLGFCILNSIISPWYASGLYMRFNTNGVLLGAAMDHYDLQCTPTYFFMGNDNDYYVAGNHLGYNESNIMFGRFSNWFLSGSAEVNLNPKSLFVMPNPCSEYFYILSDEKLPYGIEIFNISGMLVLFQSIEDNLSPVNVSVLPKGIYFVKLNNEVSKLIVN